MIAEAIGGLYTNSLALSAHICHEDNVAHALLLSSVRTTLHDRFGIDHLTIQIETLTLEAEAVYVCETGVNCFEPAKTPDIKGNASRARLI